MVDNAFDWLNKNVLRNNLEAANNFWTYMTGFEKKFWSNNVCENSRIENPSVIDINGIFTMRNL